MAGRLFALARTLVVSALFVSLWTWLVPRWMAAGKGVAFRFEAGWPLILVAAGALVVVRCFLDFAWQGLGTPAPFDPPRRFVVTGFYRRVRNPMYLGMALILIGEALLLPGLLSEMLVMLAVFAAAAALFVIAYEEPHLRQTFGAPYEDYLTHVPRWIPRLRAYRA